MIQMADVSTGGPRVSGWAVVFGAVFILAALPMLSSTYRNRADDAMSAFCGNSLRGRGVARSAIVAGWSMASLGVFLFITYWSGDATTGLPFFVSIFFAVITVACWFAMATSILFNYPKFVVLKRHRSEPGLINSRHNKSS